MMPELSLLTSDALEDIQHNIRNVFLIVCLTATRKNVLAFIESEDDTAAVTSSPFLLHGNKLLVDFWV